jgi:protein NrfD
MIRLAKLAFFLIWLVLAAAGVWGLWLRLSTGHQLADYNNYIPWGLWVAFYIYFIGLSAGSFILSSVVYVGRVEKLAPLAPLALFTAAITLVMALLSIAMDLGHMNRSIQVMLHANFRSMMAWMIFLYSTYFGVILVENLLALVPRLVPWRERRGLTGWAARQVTRIPEPFAERWLHRLGMVGVPLAIAFHGGVGALFATIGARMYWHQPLFPIIFLVGALASGCGGLAAIYYVVWPDRGPQFRETLVMLGRLVLVLVLADSLLEWAEFSTPLWQGISHESEIFHHLLFGPYRWNFWIFHIALGVVVPVALLVGLPRKAGAVALAGGLVAVTFLSVRLNLVVPPLTQPMMEGLGEAYHSQRAVFEYFPSLFEWLVSGGILALGAALFFLGIKLLPLLPDRPPKSTPTDESPGGEYA